MNSYAILNEQNRAAADSFIEFLALRQEEHEQELLETLREYEEGRSVGPFETVDELMADLYA